ncbi:MAG: hypothetical protein FD143_3653, partial [Ignavibacteria bacterium]
CLIKYITEILAESFNLIECAIEAMAVLIELFKNSSETSNFACA